MTLYYRVSRAFSPRHGARTLAEMCQIVTYFANTMGYRTVACAE
jgi:hypothetical protein